MVNIIRKNLTSKDPKLQLQGAELYHNTPDEYRSEFLDLVYQNAKNLLQP